MNKVRFASTKTILLSCFVALIILVTGCEQKPSALPPLDAFGFDTWVEIFNQRANEVVQARNNFDPDIISTTNVRGKLEQELSSLSLAYPDYEIRLRDTYLSRHEGFVVADSWNWEPYPTAETWTKDHPLTEYHWISFDEGKISKWQVMYGQELHTAAGSPLDQRILQDYAAAWSSGNPESLAGLYTSGAIRQEPLLWENKYGTAQIVAFANKFFNEFPGARLELLQSFGEFPDATHMGGIYAIHVQKPRKTCAVRALVVLEPEHDKISKEWVFYQAGTLFDCGWVR
jgi:starvation-inducible outer membrane lipoprotein